MYGWESSPVGCSMKCCSIENGGQMGAIVSEARSRRWVGPAQSGHLSGHGAPLTFVPFYLSYSYYAMAVLVIASHHPYTFILKLESPSVAPFVLWQAWKCSAQSD